MISNIYYLDSNTLVIDELLSEKEKEKLNLNINKFITINEIGFKEPVCSNSWKDNIFNICISDNKDFNDVDFKVFNFNKIPKRFKTAINKYLKNKNL
jgi:hypothetical protein